MLGWKEVGSRVDETTEKFSVSLPLTTEEVYSLAQR